MLASTTSKVVFPSLPRSVVALAAATSLLLMPRYDAAGQGTQQTVVAILAHADDETPAGPILARYAREGARVFLIVATDGGQGTGGGGSGVRRDSVPPDELARTRGEEARWGPDGGVGHPDHRIVSGVITQLVRAGAPGAPERLYYIYLPAEAFRAMNPQRGAPPLLIPQEKYFTVRVPFTPADLNAAQRSMACHRSQFTPEVLQRVFPAQAQVWNGTIAFTPAFATSGGTDLFR